jgi:adenylate kinase
MPDEKFLTVLLFGVPGVGKGTQGKILGQTPGFFHLSCGEVFRSLDTNTPLGREVESYLSRGDLVPDELTVRLWSETMRAHVAAGRYVPRRDLLVLDGIPRSGPQARMLDEHLEVLRILHLVAADETAVIDRLKRRALAENRTDDADEDVIRRRFEVYRWQTQPVLEHYSEALVLNLEALSPPDQVARNIQAALAPLRARYFAAGTG